MNTNVHNNNDDNNNGNMSASDLNNVNNVNNVDDVNDVGVYNYDTGRWSYVTGNIDRHWENRDTFDRTGNSDGGGGGSNGAASGDGHSGGGGQGEQEPHRVREQHSPKNPASSSNTPSRASSSSSPGSARLATGMLFPCVGLRSFAAKVTINFGARPFRFDLNSIIDFSLPLALCVGASESSSHTQIHTSSTFAIQPSSPFPPSFPTSSTKEGKKSCHDSNDRQHTTPFFHSAARQAVEHNRTHTHSIHNGTNSSSSTPNDIYFQVDDTKNAHSSSSGNGVAHSDSNSSHGTDSGEGDGRFTFTGWASSLNPSLIQSMRNSLPYRSSHVSGGGYASYTAPATTAVANSHSASSSVSTSAVAPTVTANRDNHQLRENNENISNDDVMHSPLHRNGQLPPSTENRGGTHHHQNPIHVYQNYNVITNVSSPSSSSPSSLSSPSTQLSTHPSLAQQSQHDQQQHSHRASPSDSHRPDGLTSRRQRVGVDRV